MIISHSKKFIFLKTTKTAGTSIEVFLSQHCGENDILTPIVPHVKPHVARNYMGIWNPMKEIICSSSVYDAISTIRDFVRRKKFYNHISARTLKFRVTNRVWRDYFKFCVERNPWDKTLSHYHMVNYRTGGNMSFDEYISRGKFCLNYKKYTNLSGGIIVDRIVKYESLINELGEVFSTLGIPFNGILGVRAKSEYRKDKRHYKDVFTSYQRSVIDRAFAKEIEMHGYVY